MIKPFKLRVPNKKIKEIYNKVKKYPWSNIEDMNGWEYGTNFKYLKKISLSSSMVPSLSLDQAAYS